MNYSNTEMIVPLHSPIKIRTRTRIVMTQPTERTQVIEIPRVPIKRDEVS